MGDGERTRIVADYEAMEEKPEFVPWQIATSTAFKEGRAAEAIQALRERNRFFAGRDLETTLAKLVDDWVDWRARNPDGVATVIARTHDEIRVLSHLMRERSLEPHGNDERVVVQACRARADDARTTPLEIARGDLLRIGALVWEKKLYNGTVVEVRDFTVHDQGKDSERVEIFGRTEYGDAVSFFVDEVTDFYGRVRLDHGYAMTIASAQGRTVDAAFVLADDRAARQAIYPAATRHREHLSLYVNRAPVSATIESLRSEDQRGAPVTDDDVVAVPRRSLVAGGRQGGGARLHVRGAEGRTQGIAIDRRRRQGRRQVGDSERQRQWSADGGRLRHEGLCRSMP